MQHPLTSKFAKQIERLAYTKSIRDVFTDMIDLTLYPLIVEEHGTSFRRNPLNDYKPAEQEQMRELILTLGEIADNDGTGMYDALGDLFMEHLSFGKNGQFFTPQEVSDMMAQLQEVPEDGGTVCDCACGSGRMLLAMAKRNRHLLFYGSDIDLLCVKMATLNLALNSLKGEIAHMDALSLQHWGSFHIHRCPFTRVPYIITTGAGQTSMIGRLKATYDDPRPEAEPAPPPPVFINKPMEQMKLF